MSLAPTVGVLTKNGICEGTLYGSTMYILCNNYFKYCVRSVTGKCTQSFKAEHQNIRIPNVLFISANKLIGFSFILKINSLIYLYFMIAISVARTSEILRTFQLMQYLFFRIHKSFPLVYVYARLGQLWDLLQLSRILFV